jgi:transcription antitermination factor NusG
MEWLACRVATGKEYEVRKKILDKVPEAQIEVPRKYTKEIKAGVVKTKSERMLPGYILVGTQTPLDPFLCKDFLKIVGRVSEEEFAMLKAQEGQKEANLDAGARILVIDGPFQGCKGDVKKQNSDGTFDCRLVFHGMELEATMKGELISTIR